MAPACAAACERTLERPQSDFQESTSRFYLCLQFAIDLQSFFKSAYCGADRGIASAGCFRTGDSWKHR